MFTTTAVPPPGSSQKRTVPVAIWTRAQCIKYLEDHGVSFDSFGDVATFRSLVKEHQQEHQEECGARGDNGDSVEGTDDTANQFGVEKRIRTQKDLDLFLKSRTFAEIWAFMLKINIAVKDVRITSACSEKLSPVLVSLVQSLEQLEDLIDTIPPIDQAARYGNEAFRTFHKKLVKMAPELVNVLLVNDDAKEYKNELAGYFSASFGNETRIDYGSGHEAQFVVFLYCLEKIGLVTSRDHQGLGLVVFPAYLRVTRKLQMVYRLEPAGSRGVWGLDDYSFVPFLWGSAQLVSNDSISPTVIDDKEVVEEYADDYLYFGALKFIHQVKTGASFAQHSPLLSDVSQLPAGWPKINQGMWKMYRGEVWEKRPVMQHLLFGKIVKLGDEGENERYQRRLIE